MAMSNRQCRAARALLGWNQGDLEKAAEVSKKTIADFEREERIPYPRTLAAMQHAMETAGVEFLPEDGVKLKAHKAKRASKRDGN
jgi:transcriptional regulator with XRE-family HTH domain